MIDFIVDMAPLFIALGVAFAILLLAANDGPLSGGLRGWQ